MKITKKTAPGVMALRAVIVGLAVAALGLPAGPGELVQAQTPITVAFDMNTTGSACPGTGNGGGTDCTISSIDSCVQVTDGQTFDFDIILEGLPSGRNFAGPDFYIAWSAPSPAPPAPYLQFPAGTFTLSNRSLQTRLVNLLSDDPGSGIFVDASFPAVPHASSPDHTAIGDLGTAETNPPFTQGVIGRYSATVAPGTAAGIYGLLFDTSPSTGGPVYIYDGASYDDMCSDPGCTLLDGNADYGLIAVGMPCPAPADLKNIELQAQGIVSDQDLEVSTDYWFQLTDIVHNNGPETNPPVLVSTRMTPAGGSEVLHRVTEADQEVWVNDAPLNCTVPGAPPVFCTNNVVNGVAPVSTEIRVDPGYELKVVRRLTLPMSIPTPLTQDWGIHCLEPSTHLLHWESTIEGSYSADPDPNNNFLSLDLTVNCITEADVKVVSQVATSAPPAKAPLPYPMLYVGAGADVQIQSTVHNNGPWGPTDVQVLRQVTIPNQTPFYFGMDPLEFPDACTIAPVIHSSQEALPQSVPTNVTDTYTITCGMGGIEWDDDEDGMVDEDPLGGPGGDNDGDTAVDEDACDGIDNDGDTYTDEDDPTGDEDCDAGNPSAPCQVANGGYGCIDEDSPFYAVTPAFVTSIDNPKDPHVVDPDMTNNTHTFAWLHLLVIRPFTPEGTLTVDDADPSVDTAPVSDVCVAGSAFPCKTLTAQSIPATPPGTQPLATVTTIRGDAPGEWWQADANGVTNGEKVGKVDYTVVANPIPMAMSCATGVPIVGSFDMWDAALPNAPGYPGIPSDRYIVDTTAGPPDQDGRQEAMFPANAFVGYGFGTGEMSWSSALDRVVNGIIAGNPTAGLWARYIGVAIILDNPPAGPDPNDAFVPANLLTFDLSYTVTPGAGPFLVIGVTGEPGARSSPGDLFFCSPFTPSVKTLGLTPNLSELVQYCAVANSPAHPQHTAISMFQRNDIGEIDQQIDSFTCVPPPDTDGDTIDDVADNCPLVPNPDQTDTDGDGIGDVCDTDEADLKKLDLQAQGIQNDQNLDASVTYAFQLMDIIHNNGPEHLVPTLSKTSISPPSGFTVSHRVTVQGTEEVCLNGSCSFPPEGTVTSAGAGDLLEVIEHVNLPVSVTHQLAQDWEAHCLEPSTHVLHWQSTIEADGAYPDPEPNNDSRAYDLAVNCIVPADIKMIETYASQMPPPVGPPLTLPTIVIGEDTPLAMTTVLHNNGPLLQAATNVTTSPTIVGYPGGNPSRWPDWGNQGCTISPTPSQVQASLPVSDDQSIVQGYTINCDMGGIGRDDDADTFVDEDYVGGVGHDADGDGVVDEDACDGVDDDADTVTDEDPPNGDEDCDGLIDEDSAFYVVAVSFDSIAQLKDPHTVDPILDNNSAHTTVFMAVVRPFTPTYSFTIDATGPDQQTNPTSDICILGLPCKSLMDLSIPNIPPPAGPPAGQPLAAIMSLIGSQPGQWNLASGLDIPNGETVGKAEYAFRLSIGGLTPDRCDLQAAGASELYDTCLPPPGDPFILRSYLGEPSCAVDLPSQQAALAPPNAFNSWSHSLDSVVRWLYTLQPTAYLWDRYSGYNPMLGMPINVLVFDLSGGTGVGPWMRVVVAADPTQRTSVYMCAPFDAHLLILGQTPTSIPILTCEQPGFQSNPLVLSRSDVGTITALDDTAVCLAAEDDVSCDLTKDEAPQVGIGLDYSETVAVTIQNGIGPDEVAVELTLVSPLDCPAEWDPATVPIGGVVDPPVIEGSNQTSSARWQEPPMAAYEMRVRNVDYIVNCSAGSYSLQITQDVSPTSVPDPNMGNNECVNQPLVTASEDDVDDDTVVNWVDNCPYLFNPDQADTDSDGLGNVCDADDDNDTVPDAADNCPLAANAGQEDFDGDGQGDACDFDDDDDTVPDTIDNCRLALNPGQEDTDHDGVGDACDFDTDNDTVPDVSDNCPLVANPSQADNDGDGPGDACDPDDDNDGFSDAQEISLGSNPLNALSTPEHISLPSTCTDGIDNDLDGLPDLFDCDNDGDGIATYFDACPFTAEDMDGYQDDDGCPDTDNDMDDVLDVNDACRNVAEDIDGFQDNDGCPDADNDADGFPDSTDQCPATDWTAGPDGIADSGDEPLGQNGVPIKTKEDYDGVIDVDGCHDSPGDDWDGDGIADEVEAFVAGTNPMDMDSDDDGLCDGSAPPVCGSEDLNKNGIVDPGETDPLNPDTDGDGLTDGMERGLAQPETPGTNITSPNWHPDTDPSTTTDPLSPDTDGDTLADGAEDADHDGRRDPGETSPASADTDQDGHGDTADNCPATNNPGQEDFDADDIGDRCDDSDTDAFTDYIEFYVGSDPVDACPDNAGDPAWPPDFNNNRTVNVLDALMFPPHMGSSIGDPNYSARFDLNANELINILDVLLMPPHMGKICTN